MFLVLVAAFFGGGRFVGMNLTLLVLLSSLVAGLGCRSGGGSVPGCVVGHLGSALGRAGVVGPGGRGRLRCRRRAGEAARIDFHRMEIG